MGRKPKRLQQRGVTPDEFITALGMRAFKACHDPYISMRILLAVLPDGTLAPVPQYVEFSTNLYRSLVKNTPEQKT